MTDHFELLKSKIVSKDEIKSLLAYYKFKDKKIVFTNGCFDLVHKGHVEYLSKAASLADVMIIGLNSDDSVTRLKGENRPLQPESARSMLLASMQFITHIIVFDEDTPLELIQFIQPDFLVKGSDYSIDQIVGADVVLANGGDVKTIDLVEGYSTSSIVDKIQKDC